MKEKEADDMAILPPINEARVQAHLDKFSFDLTEPKKKKPTNRLEAIEEIKQTGLTITAMLAVGLAFPINEEESTQIIEFINNWRKINPDLANEMTLQIAEYVDSWI